jgi:hypothetical protein
VGPLGELTGREGLCGVDEREQPVLEPGLLGRGGGAGEHLQAAVDLEGVSGDRHRILAPLPKPLGEADRDRGLADPGRPEQCNHLHGR